MFKLTLFWGQKSKKNRRHIFCGNLELRRCERDAAALKRVHDDDHATNCRQKAGAQRTDRASKLLQRMTAKQKEAPGLSSFSFDVHPERGPAKPPPSAGPGPGSQGPGAPGPRAPGPAPGPRGPPPGARRWWWFEPALTSRVSRPWILSNRRAQSRLHLGDLDGTVGTIAAILLANTKLQHLFSPQQYAQQSPTSHNR